MQNQFTAIIEKDEDWYISYCPEQRRRGAEMHSFYKFFLRVTLRLCVKSFKF